MAPVGMVSVMGWFSPEVGIISLVAFLILSIILVALCAKCNRLMVEKEEEQMEQVPQSQGNRLIQQLMHTLHGETTKTCLQAHYSCRGLNQ